MRDLRPTVLNTFPDMSSALAGHAEAVLEGVVTSWEEARHWDAVLCGAAGARVRCHRLVLASASPVLCSLLEGHGGQQGEPEEEVTVLLPGLAQPELQLVAQACYTGTVCLDSGAGRVAGALQQLQVPLLGNTQHCSQPILPDLQSDLNNVVETQIFDLDTVDVEETEEQVVFSNQEALSDMHEEESNIDVDAAVFLKCESCDKIFRSEAELDTHIQREHEECICDLCNKILPSVDAMNQHKSTHRAAKNFKCSKCDQVFRWRAEYRRHAEAVHGQKITDLTTCNICNKQIVSKRLNEHIKSVHGNEKPFICSQCNKKFAKPSELKNHIRTHTGERPFECDLCNATFAYSHILNRHKKYHDGTKKFTCNLCNKSFLQKNDLVKHNRIHSGEKPYKCDLCDKDFARMDYLKKHQLLHATETKFCCSECGELCGSVDGLKKHRTYSHGKDKPQIELNSFDDLALQLPSISNLGADSVMESMQELQAVSIDGGKTIMILNEADQVYTETVQLKDELELLQSGRDTILSANSVPELVLANSDPLSDTQVLYAVQY